MKLAGAFLAALTSLSAQTLVPPLAGTVVDGQGRIVVLSGVLGNLLPPQYKTAPTELQGGAILFGAFGANGGVLKTESLLALFDQQGSLLSVQPAAAGNALVSFSSNGTPAWVFYPAGPELVNITSGTSMNASSFGDRVIALGQMNGSSIQVLTRSGSQLWNGAVSVPGGLLSTQNPIPGAAPGAFFAGGWLTSSKSGLYWTPVNGAAGAREIVLPESASSIQTASGGAVVINGLWLLNAHFQLLEIPQTKPPVRKAEADR